jgi:hypothetical protein
MIAVPGDDPAHPEVATLGLDAPRAGAAPLRFVKAKERTTHAKTAMKPGCLRQLELFIVPLNIIGSHHATPALYATVLHNIWN